MYDPHDLAELQRGVVADIRVQRSVASSRSLADSTDASQTSTPVSSIRDNTTTTLMADLRKADLQLALAAARAADLSRLDLGLATNARLRRLARATLGRFRSQLAEPVLVRPRYPTMSYARLEHELPSMGLNRWEWAERAKEYRAWYEAEEKMIEERHRRAHARYMRRFNLAPDILPRPAPVRTLRDPPLFLRMLGARPY